MSTLDESLIEEFKKADIDALSIYPYYFAHIRSQSTIKIPEIFYSALKKMAKENDVSSFKTLFGCEIDLNIKLEKDYETQKIRDEQNIPLNIKINYNFYDDYLHLLTSNLRYNILVEAFNLIPEEDFISKNFLHEQFIRREYLDVDWVDIEDIKERSKREELYKGLKEVSGLSYSLNKQYLVDKIAGVVSLDEMLVLTRQIDYGEEILRFDKNHKLPRGPVQEFVFKYLRENSC